APDVLLAIDIAKASQAIELEAVTGLVVGEGVAVSAVAGSSLPVNLEARGACIVDGFDLRPIGSGTCSITASQAGDIDWAAAEPVSTTTRIGRGRQAIEFEPLPDTVFGADPLPLAAAAGSGLRVELTAEGPCSILDGRLVTDGAGICTVTASQPGDVDWIPASEIDRTFRIDRAPQDITFRAIGLRLLGEPPIELDGSTNSGLTVAFSASGPCVLDGDVLTLLGSGECSVAADQPGDADWAAAPEVLHSIRIVAPITGRRGDFAGKVSDAPPGTLVGSGARITSSLDPGREASDYYAIALARGDVLELRGLDQRMEWDIFGPSDFAADEVIWNDLDIDSEAEVARWLATDSGIHTIRVRDVSSGTEPSYAYTLRFKVTPNTRG
ncbi:MAG: hypothetical protein ACC726_11120, partial [Chloroflexota bacterium]